VTKNTTKKTPNALKATKSTATKTTKTLSTTQLTQKVAQLENTIATLIKVLNDEFKTEMLQGPRGVSKSMSKAGLLKDS
jgi:ABC-type sugar transport system substrate-binding protein